MTRTSKFLRNRNIVIVTTSITLLLLLILLDIFVGSVHITIPQIIAILSGKERGSPLRDIILMIRIPRTLTSCVAGGALAVSGLVMQTLFRNPLAGPYVLGISSGATLGVALAVMASGIGGAFGISFAIGDLEIISSASIGALMSLMLISTLSGRIREISTLLIVGLMLGHITGALVGILQFYSDAKTLQGFVMWELGSFSNITMQQLYLLAGIVFVGLLASFVFSKSLDILLLGENYAKSLGINLKALRYQVIFATALLAGSVTAFCGPIAFLGMAVPHMGKGIFNTSRHRILIPGVALIGALVAVLCDIIAQLPFTQYALPVNVVTSLVGAPVVIWVIMRRNRMHPL